MPQLTIPNNYEPSFIAKLANLGTAWGITPEGKMAIAPDMIDNYFQACEDYPAAFLAFRKEQRLEELAHIRRTKEIQGPNGLTLDDKTVSRLTAAAVGLLIDQSRESVRWELTRGNFITMPRNTVLGLSVASVNKVQGCFDTVYEKTQEINAVELGDNLQEALDALEAIDLESGWPA